MATFWQTAPDQQLIPNLRTYRERVLDAIFGLAKFFAASIEAAAKQGAPWHDRTGAARQGLRGFAVKAATYVVIVLTHSVNYGLWLEVAHGGKYAIIMKTLRQFYPQVMDAARRLVA